MCGIGQLYGHAHRGGWNWPRDLTSGQRHICCSQGSLKSIPYNSIWADTSQTPIKWESVDVTPQLKDGKTVIPDKAIDSVKKNFVALKGPLAV